MWLSDSLDYISHFTMWMAQSIAVYILLCERYQSQKWQCWKCELDCMVFSQKVTLWLLTLTGLAFFVGP